MRLIKMSKDGFTIIELVAAIIVTVILVVGINSIYITHMVQSQKTRNTTIVNSYVENKIESLRSKGFLGVSDGTFDTTSELSSELDSPKSGSMQISSYTSGIKKIVLTITYNDFGTPRVYKYTTYIGELGVGQY